MREGEILRKHPKRLAKIPFDGLWRKWFGWLGFHEIVSNV
jgi:hypothetical protein